MTRKEVQRIQEVLEFGDNPTRILLARQLCGELPKQSWMTPIYDWALNAMEGVPQKKDLGRYSYGCDAWSDFIRKYGDEDDEFRQWISTASPEELDKVYTTRRSVMLKRSSFMERVKDMRLRSLPSNNYSEQLWFITGTPAHVGWELHFDFERKVHVVVPIVTLKFDEPRNVSGSMWKQCTYETNILEEIGPNDVFLFGTDDAITCPDCGSRCSHPDAHYGFARCMGCPNTFNYQIEDDDEKTD